MKCFQLKIILIAQFFYVVNSYAQDIDSSSLISIQYENEALRNVLVEITQQSKIKFVYDDNLVDSKTISCSFNNYPIENSLSQLFSKEDISYKIFENRLVVLFGKNLYKTNNFNNQTINHYLSNLAPENGFQPTPFTLPTLKDEKEPDYPEKAKDKGLDGVVEMNLLISTSGDVKIAEIKKSSGHRILDNSALSFARNLKFNPAKAGNKTIELWVTRNIVYKIVKPSDFPLEYIKKIKQLTVQADHLTGDKKSKITNDILNTLEKLAGYRYSKSQTFNYNAHIKEIVKLESAEKWEDFWDGFPLRFLIFNDFILRYPESNQKAKATELLLSYLKEDIMCVKDLAKENKIEQQNADMYIKNIYLFLTENYPQVLTIDLQMETDY